MAPPYLSYLSTQASRIKVPQYLDQKSYIYVNYQVWEGRMLRFLYFHLSPPSTLLGFLNYICLKELKHSHPFYMHFLQGYLELWFSTLTLVTFFQIISSQPTLSKFDNSLKVLQENYQGIVLFVHVFIMYLRI